MAPDQRRRIRVTGTVQGVGFRPFVWRLATGLALAGEVSNDTQGVLIEAEGPSDALDTFEARLRSDHPPLARVESVEAKPVAVTGLLGFSIVASRDLGGTTSPVSVDIATCADCLAEMADPDDRRYHYPFINCTNCGPRYTIIRSIPYDRASTTMSGFTMCDACRQEYEDPGDRRFHAEPVACPACGPVAILRSATDGATVATGPEAVAEAARRLVAGQILAVKGLGGYHLAVDANHEQAVSELRRRKARDHKPFAVMVPGLDQAHDLVQLSPQAADALVSPRRPIVLAPRRPGGVADPVAPGLSELGVMLAYTPLHYLLLEATGRPLVMTSGNLSDEPIAHIDDDAMARLGPMVHAVLTHDRPIHIRCDDSVVRLAPQSGETQLIRRSRGYAPEPILLTWAVARPLLAVGAELKNTVSVAAGRALTTSHHIGDLEHLAAFQSFRQAIDHLCHLAGVIPEVVAHDLHPEYVSTKFADDLDLPAIAVQHHHAHIASCLVDHFRDDRVLGIAFDGTGMGDDGTLWGGEFLVADLDGYERVGHLLPVTLPGGAAAIREPWRMAMQWSTRACSETEARRYGASVDERWEAVLDLIERATGPVTTSAGRLFDAVSALLGIRDRISYEAQAAIELEARAAGQALVPARPWENGAAVVATPGQPSVLDPSPLVARVIAERDRGTPVAEVSAAFHEAFGRATADLAADLAGKAGVGVVALSGGVFQNARLSAVVEANLKSAGLEVLVHCRVPPNDGGVSIGQAAVVGRLNA